jgi:hypothetical protein
MRPSPRRRIPTSDRSDSPSEVWDFLFSLPPNRLLASHLGTKAINLGGLGAKPPSPETSHARVAVPGDLAFRARFS